MTTSPIPGWSGNHIFPLAERFECYVDRSSPTGCWLWTGSLNPSGYGQIHVRSAHRPIVAHRVAWELYREPIPAEQTDQTIRTLRAKKDVVK